MSLSFALSSSSVCSKTATSELNSSLFDEMKQAQEDKREVDKDQKVKDGEKTKEEEELDNGSDCLEWELRNTDSVFSELSELSSEYVENVDQGASVRGTIVCLIFYFLFLENKPFQDHFKSPCLFE